MSYSYTPLKFNLPPNPLPLVIYARQIDLPQPIFQVKFSFGLRLGLSLWSGLVLDFRFVYINFDRILILTKPEL